MIRNQFDAFSGIALFLFFAIPTVHAVGEDAFTLHFRDKIETSEPASKDYLLAKHWLTKSLRQSNSKLAIENATEAVEIARLIGEDYLEVAIADLELTRRLADYRKPPIELDRLAILDGKLEPELQLSFFLTKLESELWLEKSNANLRRLLAEGREVAAKCDDPFMSVYHDSLDLYVRVFRLNESPNTPEMVLQRDRIRQESLRLDYQTGIVIDLLVLSSDLKHQKRHAERIVVLEQALEVAKSNNNELFAMRCNEVLGVIFRIAKNWDESRVHCLAALQSANSLGSQPLEINVLSQIMTIELESGRPKSAARYRERMDSYSASHQLPLLTKNSVNRHLNWIRSSLDDGLAQTKMHPVLAPELVKELQDSEKKRESNAEQSYLALERAKNQGQRELAEERDRANLTQNALQDSHSQLAANYEQTLQFFKKYSLFATVLVFLLVPWFVLFLMRSKLNFVNKALDTERESSLQNKIKCDELAARLNRLQRMESLGLMAGSVAHDFNNILVGVLGNAEVLQMKHDAEPNGRHNEFVNERISSIIKSAEKAASLSRQMLAYAGKQYIARRSTDLNELIRGYQSILISACQENQKVELKLCPDQVVAKVDVTQIEQVVLNLVTNAVEASNEEGRITISTGFHFVEDISDDCSLYGTRTNGGEFCYIDVFDTGSGISKLDMERIFEPFFSNSELGRGLGLSVVYGVAVGHDGFVKCTSEIGKGTTFRVMLPVSSEPAVSDPDAQLEHPVKTRIDAAHQNLPARKILIVDDEETVVDLCSQLMQLNGWEVLTAVGGEDGLELATRYRNELSCILMDVVMPEMGASELLREFEMRGINVPVVVMSGFSQTKLEFFLDKPNVMSIVQKPFRASQIKQAIENAMDFGQEDSTVALARLAQQSPD